MMSDRLLRPTLVLLLSSISASVESTIATDQTPPVLFTIVENQTENEIVGQLVRNGGAYFRSVIKLHSHFHMQNHSVYMKRVSVKIYMYYKYQARSQTH